MNSKLLNHIEEIKEAIIALDREPLYEERDMRNGVSVRFLARMTMLKHKAGLLDGDSQLVIEASEILK
jgi:hypothetical protein